MQNNGDKIKELGLLSEVVYKNDYFIENNPDTAIDYNDKNGLENSYIVR